ncbi:hypothetical protein HK097_009298 [Rhizophlyctis rosea]|uniref:Ankyrin n=1 Tax=Rhizophlyctis rosea TaxID=64517 RepID=A0AAD5SBC6_9FUNG|nr:hypothetical protein HK097_009298 [Rhizophlyctis rosea]
MLSFSPSEPQTPQHSQPCNNAAPTPTTTSLPKLPFELVASIAKWTDPVTGRSTQVACKTLSKLISRKVLSRTDASWYLLNKGDTACWSWAAKHGHIHIIHNLLPTTTAGNPGATQDLCDRGLRTAAGRGHIDIVKVMLDAGANLHATDSGPNPLYNAETLELSPERHSILLEMGVESLWHSNNWQSLKHAYDLDSPCHVVRRFFATRPFSEAELYIPGEMLLQAAGMGWTNIVTLLLEVGADVHLHNDYPLLRAASKWHADTVRALLVRGADISAKDFQAYSYARVYGRKEVINIFHAASMQRPVDILVQKG